MDALERSPGTVADLVDQAGHLLADGQSREAVDLLTAANRGVGDPRLEEELVRLRHRAVAHAVTPPSSRDLDLPDPTAWTAAPVRPAAGAPLVAEGQMAEVQASELTADRLAAALGHHGCLLVRGLLDRDTADQLREDADAAFTAARRADDGAPASDTSPWYVPFEADPAYRFGIIDRAFARHGDGVLSVESPRALAHIVAALHASGLGPVLADYLGEWPMLSAKKSTLRRATPRSLTGWHQDGAFMGTDIKTVNAWIALTACGERAPSIDVFCRTFDHVVEPGTEDAEWNWSVGDQVAARIGLELVHRPVCEPGDAVLFDHLTLHRTGVDPEMTEERVAIESWFFAPSTYPGQQIPILF